MSEVRTGVAAEADVVVATASLEVGFDDDRVGAVLQHKAPRDVAQFLQRKGRAGRNPATRPWTIVVLSDWGHDREAWDAYDVLFSPVVPARSLPLDNLYVTRIQSVYSLLDWLANELRYTKNSSWADAAGPADMLSKEKIWVEKYRERQQRMAELLSALLRDGAERASLVRHLRRALALPDGRSTDVTIDKLLWEAPRPLLGAVVPTLRRRLVDQWSAERPANDDAGLRTRTPLRDFVPGNLFDDLLVPDVEFRVPWARGEVRVEHLSALRALTEFLPGNVSRHFGVWASSKRHWVGMPDNIDADGMRLADVSLFEGIYIDDVETPDGRIPVYAPRTANLGPVPGHVSDASSMRADWLFRAIPLGEGTPLRLAGPVTNMFEQLTAHLHSQGGGMRVMRFACTARGEMWSNGQSQLERLRFQTAEGGTRTQAALGVEIYADAIQGRVVLPRFDHDITPLERADWLSESISRSNQFPIEMSMFDRLALADSAELFSASWDWSSGEPGDSQFRSGMSEAAERLELHNPANPNSVTNWLNTRDVLSAVRECVFSSRSSTRSEQWIDFLNRRFTQSAAETLLAALRSADAEDLVIDLHPDSPGEFFISEQSPGGTGHIESLTMKMIEESDKLAMAITDVLRPSDMELLDDQLRSVIESSDAAVRSAVANLAQSWPDGHEAVNGATAKLDSALEGAGIVLGHAAKTAVATRLAGPGASPDFIDELQHWLHVRDEAQQASGLAVAPRTLAALLESRRQADTHLHLTEPSDRTRSRAIANVLWPWGQLVRPTEFFNPYADSAVRSIELVRRNWNTPVEVFELTEWNETTRSEVHDSLRASGELLLRTPVRLRRILKAALVDLQTVPIEVGPLWCYPEILALQDQGATKDARLVLRETW